MTIKSVETLGEQSAAGLPAKAGVIVLSVTPGSAASAAGLRAGDVIIAAEGTPDVPAQPFATAADFIATAKARRWQGVLKLTVFRNQTAAALELKLN